MPENKQHLIKFSLTAVQKIDEKITREFHVEKLKIETAAI